MLFYSCPIMTRPEFLVATNLQELLLMHMEYQVKLFNHYFVIGPQRKLTPPVYGIYKITNTVDVSYSGDTFISIRSGKHDILNAYTYALDLRDTVQSKLVKRRPILLMELDALR